MFDSKCDKWDTILNKMINKFQDRENPKISKKFSPLLHKKTQTNILQMIHIYADNRDMYLLIKIPVDGGRYGRR